MAYKWEEIITEVQAIQNEARKNGSLLWYRGQRFAEWEVKSSLHRRIESDLRAVNHDLSEPDKVAIMREVNKTLFHRFKARAWHLLDQQERSDWGIVFSMQHHGIPTRLLDWTESFACAVYFANDGRKPCEEAAIYILDPQALNKEIVGGEGVVALGGDMAVGRINTNHYHPAFLSNPKPESKLITLHKSKERVIGVFGIATDDAQAISDLLTIAVAPVLSNSRMRVQRCAFTLSGDSFHPMEMQYEKYIKKIILPAETYEDSRKFLELVGIGHFGYYPDFEGLRRELIENMDKEVGITKELFQGGKI